MTPDHQRPENTPEENRLIEAGQPGADGPEEPSSDPSDLTVGEGGDSAQIDVLSE
jgi:hypothetical protein